MLLILSMIAIALVGSDVEPVYVLEYPGVAFGWLPEEMLSVEEGTLTEDAGVVTSPPNAHGSEFRIYYWEEELEPNTRKDLWLSNRFRSTVSPDILPSLLISSPSWEEGSTLSPMWETSSVGLIPVIDFNMIAPDGDIIGRGRACAVFTDNHSILIYSMIPYESPTEAAEAMNMLVGNMYLLP